MLPVANGELIAAPGPGGPARELEGVGTCSGGSSPSARPSWCRARRCARGGVGSVQRGGQPAARVARQRVLDPEAVEHGDEHAAHVVLVGAGARAAPRAAGRRRARARRRHSARTRRRARGGSCSRRMRAARPSAWKPGARDELECGVGLAARVQEQGQRTAASGRLGSSSSARRSDASSPAATRRRPRGHQRVEEALDRRRGLSADELVDDPPSRKALTAGIPWMPKPRDAGLASVSSLASTTWPSRASAARSSSGVSGRQGPHHSAQKSTTTGLVASARRPPRRSPAR